MTSMLVQPQLIATAASDAAGIGSAIEQARSAAAAQTTGLVAAAEDEVSAAAAALFGSYGQQYQAMLAQASAFHDQFVAALSSAGATYAQAEASVAGTLGLATARAATTTNFTTPYTPTATNVIAQLILTGSGTATPSPTYMTNVATRYLTQFTLPTGVVNQAVSTAEGLYPFTGVKDLTLNISLARDVTELNNAIEAAVAPGSSNAISVLTYSQSSIAASMAMPILHEMGYGPNQINFTLLGDVSAPNGGLFARFPDLSLPSLGVTFGNSTPSDLFKTTIYSLEYDGFADFPQYPIDFLADLNALAGIVFIHGTYPTLTASQIASGFLLPGSEQLGANTLTNYVMIPTQNLPLLDPLRAIPVIGNPLADLVQPDLRYLINWGYGDPNYGFSTGPANVQTPFGFLPPLSATTALGPLLVSGTQQGMAAFGADISAMLPTSLPAMALPNLSVPGIAGALAGGASAGTTALALPSVSSIPATLTNLIGDIENANNAIVGGFATDFSTAYATLLPTADIATALAVSMPSYDVNLFLNGITQAINGNPMGLLNAIGDPIAADTALVTLAGGFEFINFENALQTILLGVPNPGPY